MTDEVVDCMPGAIVVEDNYRCPAIIVHDALIEMKHYGHPYDRNYTYWWEVSIRTDSLGRKLFRKFGDYDTLARWICFYHRWWMKKYG